RACRRQAARARPRSNVGWTSAFSWLQGSASLAQVFLRHKRGRGRRARRRFRRVADQPDEAADQEHWHHEMRDRGAEREQQDTAAGEEKQESEEADHKS